ncbi:MAG: type II 3-dehydroquinate dehydratase [Aureispira sp.]|nr:type II 3-dehydroquinate dehydratase [Aureispira sp.]
MKILILNGPNLNLLGNREPEIYGTATFDAYFSDLEKQFPTVKLSYYQSNVEGHLIDKLHEVGFDWDGIILNAGAYTHTSLALGDAIAGISTPVVEVHISNVFARESVRHHSFIAQNCIGSISGFGMRSYELALKYWVDVTNE